MKEHPKIIGGTVNARQILIGVLGLLIGTLVYLVDRPPDQIYFIYKNGLEISLYKILPRLFGSIGNSLPTFFHVFAFILITAGLTSYRKRDYLTVCTLWFVIDCGFEMGQRYKMSVASIIPEWFAHVPCLENTHNFFVKGTFDWLDVGFICLGTITAYTVLAITNKTIKEEQP